MYLFGPGLLKYLGRGGSSGDAGESCSQTAVFPTANNSVEKLLT